MSGNLCSFYLLVSAFYMKMLQKFMMTGEAVTCRSTKMVSIHLRQVPKGTKKNLYGKFMIE